MGTVCCPARVLLSAAAMFSRLSRGLMSSASVMFVSTLLVCAGLLVCTEARGLEVPRYETVYACEGKTLKIDCKPGEQINLIRANYGRFSITICNDHGNTEWSVICMAPKSLRVLHNKCSQQQNCSILASTSMFGDPCPGTLKYLEAHYQCMPTTMTVTTKRPSPPWLITSQPSVWSTSTIRAPTARVATTSTSVRPITPTPASPPTPPVKFTVAAPSPSPTRGAVSAPVAPVTPRATAPSNASQVPPRLQPTTRKQNVIPLREPQPPRVLPEEDVTQRHVPLGVGTGTDATNSGESGVSSEEHESHAVAPSNGGTVHQQDNGGDSTTYGQQYQHYCAPNNARNLVWNWTRVNEVNVQPCPGGATGLARWRCVPFNNNNNHHMRSDHGVNVDHGDSGGTASSGGTRWYPESPDLSECRSVWLNSLEQRVNEGESLIAITNDLSQVTSSKTLYGGDMMTTTKIIKKMAQKMAVDIQTFPDQRQREAIVTDLLHGVVLTGSNLLDSSQHPSWMDLSYDDQMRVATSLLIGLEENAFLLADTVIRERTVTQAVKNILLSVRVLETKNIGTEIFPSDKVLEQWTASNDFIQLPREAVIENSEGGLVRLVFVAFDRLEEILKPPNEDQMRMAKMGDNDQSQKLNVTRVLNSKVISASLGKGRHIQLSQPIKLSLRHLKTENVSNPSCVFWDYTVNIWSEEGCRVESTNQTHTTCLCDHLTNFAILMDVHSTTLSPAHQVALQIITYIGCIISVVCLVLAIVTFQLFKGLKSDRTTIHKNLCVCLLLAELVFVAGINQTAIPVLCGIIAGLLHFFFLCAFSWMFLEGFQLYVMLIEVFEAEKSRIRWYYTIAYGAPFIIVAVSVIIDPFSYGTPRYCWLRADNFFIFSFVGPVMAVILANLVFLSMALFMMCRHANSTVSMKSKEHSRLASLRAWLRGAVVLVFLLGLTWTFGLLYLNEESVVMAYIFTALNSLQGMFIFLFHCIQNEKVLKEYRKFIRRHSWLPKCLRCSKSSGSGSTTGSGSCTGTGVGKERRSSLYGPSNSNPSGQNTDSTGLTTHAADGATNSYVLQNEWESRGYNTMNRSNKTSMGQPDHGMNQSRIYSQSDLSQDIMMCHDNHKNTIEQIESIDNPNSNSCLAINLQSANVSTLPYVRKSVKYNGGTLNPNIPKSATTTWGPNNKPLVWQNISYKSYSRDSGHGGSEQEESPRPHDLTMMTMSNKEARENRRHHITTPAEYHVTPEYLHNHPIAVPQVRQLPSNGQLPRKNSRAASPWNHMYSEIRDGRRIPEDDPVYEEIERNEIPASDISDDDAKRQSDMSRQSSRSYGDHRPLIPYSPIQGPVQQHGDRFIKPWNYGPTPEQARSLAAVLDGDTVVCHLEPQELYLRDSYNSRTIILPPYSEC